MAAIVKFLRPGEGEPVYVNADQVLSVTEAPKNRAMLHFATTGYASALEVDVTAEAAAEALTSAAPGFVVNNAYVAVDDPAALEQGLAEAAKEGAPPDGG